MQKTILITGATDGIGLATAKMLVSLGHNLIIHGRNSSKLNDVKKQLMALSAEAKIDSVIADLSELKQVEKLAKNVLEKFPKLDVLINNAGVFKVTNTRSIDGLDVRFAVNSVAPYYLTELLMPLLSKAGRVVNLSSAAQAPVNLQALLGKIALEDMQAYAQSKLAIRLCSKSLSLLKNTPTCIAVNPGSLLATKMVKEGFGMVGNDLSIGANVLTYIALDDDMFLHNGEYFDNDLGRFSNDIPATQEIEMAGQVVETIKTILSRFR